MKHFHLIDSLPAFFPSLSLCTLCLALFSCSDAGNRPWTAHSIHASTDTAEEIQTITLADLNLDGRQEVLVSRENSAAIELYSSELSEDGSILWTEHRIPVVAGIQQLHIWQTGTRENPETFLVAAAGDPTMQVLFSPVPAADAVFQANAWNFTALSVPGGDWSALHSADFNNDGISDLALAGRSLNENNTGAPEIIWMSNARTGERTVVVIGESAAPSLMFADDVEQDGDIDLLVVDAATGSNSMGAYWLENPWPENPEVQWKRNFITLSSLKPVGARVVDFDRDQRLDLLLCLQEQAGTHRLMCFKKVTAATEVAWLPLPLPVSGKQGALHHSEVADIDQDSFPDLVLGFSTASDPLEHLTWLRNPTSKANSPTWIRRALSGGSQSSATRGIALCDVDGDGDADVISADEGGALRWYENTVPAATVEDPPEK